jgi:uracil-DNA glycosylase family 4
MGKWLEEEMDRFRISLHADCKIINAVNCRPPKNRTPTPTEIDCCRSRVWGVIDEFKPRLILVFGASALESVLGHRWTKDSLGGISRWRGWRIPDGDVKAWICPIWHPSFINRQGNDQSATLPIFRRDLQRAFQLLKEPEPEWWDLKKASHQVSLLGEKEAERYLTRLLDNPPERIAIDFETTGLKPQSKGHKVVCAAIADSRERSRAFPVTPVTKPPLRRVLRTPRIQKVGQNIKFEQLWAGERLGAEIQGWAWDTVLASHLLDNRRGVCSLEFQSYVQLGLLGFKDETSDMLAGVDPKNANSKNQAELIPPNVLKMRCGMDALATYRLAQKQEEQMNDELERCVPTSC